MTFAERFIQLCDRRGLTPSGALRSMGLSASALRRWKEDNVIPMGHTRGTIADFFGVERDIFNSWIESGQDGYALEITKDPPPEFKAKPNVSSPVGDSSISYLSQALRDPVIAAYLEIVSKCTPEQKEFLDDVLNKLDEANKKRNEKN